MSATDAVGSARISSPNACERNSVTSPAEPNRQLDGGEVLHLVDHQVLDGERPLRAGQLPALQLEDAQQERVVLGIEGVDLGVLAGVAAPRAQPIALGAPAMDVVELAARK